MSTLVDRREGPVESPGEPVPDAPPDLRLDPAHLTAGSNVPLTEPPSPVPDEGSPMEAEPPSNSQEQLLIQALQIADHLQRQCNEMDRREQRLHAQLAQIDEERRNVRLWVSHFETQVHEREDALDAKETDCARRLAACEALEEELRRRDEELRVRHQAFTQERDQFAREREVALAEIKTAREHLDQWLDEARQELEQERADCDAILATDRTRHRELIDAEKQSLAAERKRLMDDLHQERGRLETRARFHQDHLQRLRQEFEAAQVAVTAAQQERQTFLVERAQQLDQREWHVLRARELLEIRLQAVEREGEQLSRSRRLFVEAAETERLAQARERQEWEAERQTQQADLHRQQDLLAAHAENLETRRVRLDRLRAELEDTNRKTLEMRLAVEEANAQLCQSVGQEVAQARVDEARQVLSEYYRHTRDSLIALRRELTEQDTRLRSQSQDLHEEREALTRWISEEESRLRSEREQIEAARLELAGRECEWRKKADQWGADRSEAEAVIRDLLQQLQRMEDAPPGPVPLEAA